MPSTRDKQFIELVEKAASELVAAEHDVTGSFIRTPLIYPSGALVVIRVHRSDKSRFFVSDWGLGFQEADTYGSGAFYTRHAKQIAEKAGVGFDNQAFFIMETSREQLVGAIVTIANCSQEAAMRSADSLAEKTFEDSKERLYERLVAVFQPKAPNARIVTKNARVIGFSTTEWPVATIVRLPGVAKPTIFEPVTKHHHSVASAAMKFNDIARLGNEAPGRVAVVHDKKEFGTLLGVLSQSARVVDEAVSNQTIQSLAEAA